MSECVSVKQARLCRSSAYEISLSRSRAAVRRKAKGRSDLCDPGRLSSLRKKGPRDGGDFQRWNRNSQRSESIDMFPLESIVASEKEQFSKVQTVLGVGKRLRPLRRDLEGSSCDLLTCICTAGAEADIRKLRLCV